MPTPPETANKRLDEFLTWVWRKLGPLTGPTSDFAAGGLVFGDANGFFTQDASQLFWDDANNRLGIGTSNPQTTLDIRGVDQMLEVSGNASGVAAGIAINPRGTGNRSAYLDLVGDDTYTDYGLRLIRNNTGSSATSFLYHRGTGSLNFETSEAADIVFRTSATERMRLTSSGDLAVAGNGTIAAPTVSHEVQGNDACLMAKGTTAQRPSGVSGYHRYNSDDRKFEGYEHATWSQFVGVLNRANSPSSISNTTTETAIYSFTVPGGIINSLKALRLTLFGNYSNNSGSTRTVRVRVKYAGTIWYDDTTAAIASSADAYPFFFQILLAGTGGATNNRIGGCLAIGAVGATTGRGDLATDEIVCITPISGNVVTGDTSANQTLEVTIQHSFAASTIVWFQDYAILEVL